MIKHALVLWSLVLVTSCFQTHDGNEQVLRNTDCYGCHKPAYEATGGPLYPAPVPMHTDPNQQCTTDCVQCHTTETWVNSLGGCAHPEGPTLAGTTGFPLHSLGTMHTNIKCIDCHSDAITIATGATSVAGANTDCLSCHPNDVAQQQDHIGVTYDPGTPNAGQPYAYLDTVKNFCLGCHPQGLGIGHGANNPFILPHAGRVIPCSQCHDNASMIGHKNGNDVNCVNGACHNRLDHDCPPGTGLHGPAPAGGPPSCTAAGCHPNGRKPNHGC